MHQNHSNKKPAGDDKPTAGQHTNEAKNNAGLPNMASYWHRMGQGYFCCFSIKDGNLQSTWRPCMPPTRKLRRIVDSGKYFAARHAFMLELSERVGGTVVCVDM